jgi:tryptophan-rich sensory protein
MSRILKIKRFFNRTAGLSFLKLVVSIAACLSAGVIGSFFTARSVKSWYVLVEKPPISPPDSIFAPVWTTLYILMGISFFLVWRQAHEGRRHNDALMSFILQLLVNIMWPMFFFGFHSIVGGLVILTLLTASIVWTMKRFFPFSRTAAVLLVPYLLWTGYALILNGWIALINKPLIGL